MDINDNYIIGSPSSQNAVDLFAGTWASRIPEPGVTTGNVPLFEDSRIAWLIEHRGRLDGLKVLELGPLEGGHTYMMEQAGAESVLGIEANTLAFMKCLISKEIMGMTRSRFMLGDFDLYLRETTQTFDLILASGVLYHMVDPMVTLSNMARRTNEMFIWSHFFDAAAMPEDDSRRVLFTGQTETRTLDGREMTYHLRGYGESVTEKTFIGGTAPRSVWLEKGQTIDFLRSHGFSVTPAFEHDDHPHGPAACLYARR